MLVSESEQPNAFPQRLTVREVHTLRADVDAATGSTDSAPSPHDYFDAALATCKSLTATWYARKNQLPLERVTTRVEHDNTQEKHHLRGDHRDGAVRGTVKQGLPIDADR